MFDNRRPRDARPSGRPVRTVAANRYQPYSGAAQAIPFDIPQATTPGCDPKVRDTGILSARPGAIISRGFVGVRSVADAIISPIITPSKPTIAIPIRSNVSSLNGRTCDTFNDAVYCKNVEPQSCDGTSPVTPLHDPHQKQRTGNPWNPRPTAAGFPLSRM